MKIVLTLFALMAITSAREAVDQRQLYEAMRVRNSVHRQIADPALVSHSERALALREAHINFSDVVSSAQVPVYALCEQQIDKMATEMNVLQNFKLNLKKRDLVVNLASKLNELRLLREQKVEILNSFIGRGEQQEAVAWYLKKQIRAVPQAQKQLRELRRSCSNFTSRFLSKYSIEDALKSHEFVISVRILQSTRLLHKVLKAYSNELIKSARTLLNRLPINRKLSSVSQKLGKARDWVFDNASSNMKELLPGTLALGSAIAANKFSQTKKKVNYLNKEYFERMLFLGKMGLQNSVLFNALRGIRNCVDKIDSVSYQVKRKIQTELEEPFQ